jgi:hypothetical protein
VLKLRVLAPLDSLSPGWVEELGEAEPELVEEGINVEVTIGAVEKIDVLAVPSSTWK